MIAAVIAFVLALLSIVLAIPVLAAWVRGRRIVAGRDLGQSVLVVVPLPRGAAPGRSLARSLAAAAHGGPLAVRVACSPGGTEGDRWVEEARRAAPALDARVVTAAPPGRHVPAAWLAVEASRGDASEVVALVDSRVRPTARDLARLLACPGSGGATWVAAVPVPGTGAGAMGAMLATLAGDLAPLVAASCGAEALPTLLAAGTRDAWDAAVRDPLALNRPSLAVSAALRAGPAAALVPVPSALAAGREGQVLRESVAVLWRARPGGTAVVAAALLALPLALVARGTATGSAAAGVAMTAVVLAWTARLAVAATWTRGTRGTGAALASALAAPIRDAAALLVLAVGAASARIEAGGTRFRIRRGGVLVPTADDRGAVDDDF
jgi:hypothetical protein